MARYCKSVLYPGKLFCYVLVAEQFTRVQYHLVYRDQVFFYYLNLDFSLAFCGWFLLDFQSDCQRELVVVAGLFIELERLLSNVQTWPRLFHGVVCCTDNSIMILQWS